MQRGGLRARPSNGLWLQSAYDPLTGALTQRRSGTGGAESNVQQLAYGWDEAGNLASRQDLNQGLTETFGYDANGNLSKRNGKSLTWRSYNLPSLINVKNYSAAFSDTARTAPARIGEEPSSAVDQDPAQTGPAGLAQGPRRLSRRRAALVQ